MLRPKPRRKQLRRQRSALRFFSELEGGYKGSFNWALELFLKEGTIMKQKFILLSPWLLKSPVSGLLQGYYKGAFKGLYKGLGVSEN